MYGIERKILSLLNNFLINIEKYLANFGDAGSATIIEKGSDTLDFILKTDGSGSHYLNAEKQLNINDKAIFIYGWCGHHGICLARSSPHH